MVFNRATTRVPALCLCGALCSSLLITSSVALAQGTPEAVLSAPNNSAAASTTPKQTEAAPTKEQCVDSHHLAQLAQNEGKLVRAREMARTAPASDRKSTRLNSS